MRQHQCPGRLEQRNRGSRPVPVNNSRGLCVRPRASWLENPPRVRVRHTDNRQLEELVELAVLNERLSGSLQPWEARRKLEYLRTKRKNWEAIFAFITRKGGDTTLAAIEEANKQVEEILSSAARDQTSIGSLTSQLMGMQAKVAAAQEALTRTQTRVDEELARLAALQQQTEMLERARSAAITHASEATSSHPTAQQQAAPPSLESAAPSMVSLPQTATATASSSTEASHALHSPQPTSSSSYVAVDMLASARASVSRTLVTSAPATTSTAVTVTADSSPARPTLRRAQPATELARPAPRKAKGLKSSLALEPALRQFWYAAEFSSRLTKDTMVPFELFGEPWVLFRGPQGEAGCIRDECAHRACPLSIGKVEDGQVVCPYHGWAYNPAGDCTKMPSTPHCKGVHVKALRCVEKDGFVWVWPGEGEAPDVPDTMPPPGYDIHAEIMVDVPVEHGLLIENLLDLAHAPFTHTSTFARGWPVPDMVKFHATQLLEGYWDPYPINMEFRPPCMTVSQIGLAQPGKIRRGVKAEQCDRHLHQLHVCMPSKPGHTRLLYRMSLDFIPWLKHVPFIDKVWKRVAAQVLGEDLVLVLGQQDRMQRGGDTWSNPVSYDKLAVRYRRWRNETAAGNTEGANRYLNTASMSSGQLFSIDEDDALPSYNAQLREM